MGTNMGESSRPLRPAAVLKQSQRTGRWLSILGWLAVVLGGVEYAISSSVAAGQPVVRLTGLVLIVAGTWAVVRGRRHLTWILPSLGYFPPNERIVLFLRAFSDDAGFSRVPAMRFPGMLLQSYGPTPADVRTEEDQVARAVAPFGRMVALGSPSDRLPHLGADRSYASDEMWRSEVLAALQRANLVLLVARPGRSLAWEVDQVVRRNDPMRLVVIVTRDRRQYAQFRESLGPRFPKGLPEYPKARIRLLRRGHARAAIWFDHTWTPHLETLRGGFPLIGFARRTQRALQRALRQVYQRAGVPPRIPPTAPRPWGIKLSIMLVITFWLGLAAYFIASIDLTITGFINLLPGSGDRSSPSTADLISEFLPTMLPFALALSLLMYRVWRGGPYAITIVRVHGILVGVFILVGIASGSTFLLLVVAGLTFLGGAWLLLLTIVVLLFGLLGLPAVTLLLVRQDVREWIDSRL